jgi:hypothetical protein
MSSLCYLCLLAHKVVSNRYCVPLRISYNKKELQCLVRFVLPIFLVFCVAFGLFDGTVVAVIVW